MYHADVVILYTVLHTTMFLHILLQLNSYIFCGRKLFAIYKEYYNDDCVVD